MDSIELPGIWIAVAICLLIACGCWCWFTRSHRLHPEGGQPYTTPRRSRLPLILSRAHRTARVSAQVSLAAPDNAPRQTQAPSLVCVAGRRTRYFELLRLVQESRLMRIVREQLARHRLMLTPVNDYSHNSWVECYTIWVECMHTLEAAAERGRVADDIRGLKPKTGWWGEQVICWLLTQHRRETSARNVQRAVDIIIAEIKAIIAIEEDKMAARTAERKQ